MSLWDSTTRQFTALLSLGSLLPLFWGQHDTNLLPNQSGIMQGFHVALHCS
jgi:hypothetical protein